MQDTYISTCPILNAATAAFKLLPNYCLSSTSKRYRMKQSQYQIFEKNVIKSKTTPVPFWMPATAALHLLPKNCFCLCHNPERYSITSRYNISYKIPLKNQKKLKTKQYCSINILIIYFWKALIKSQTTRLFQRPIWNDALCEIKQIVPPPLPHVSRDPVALFVLKVSLFDLRLLRPRHVELWIIYSNTRCSSWKPNLLNSNQD